MVTWKLVAEYSNDTRKGNKSYQFSPAVALLWHSTAWPHPDSPSAATPPAGPSPLECSPLSTKIHSKASAAFLTEVIHYNHVDSPFTTRLFEQVLDE